MKKSIYYCVLVTCSAQTNLKLEQGLEKCYQILQNGNQIQLLFLQYDAVLLANTMSVIPSEETNMATKWQEFVQNKKINAHVCINSALRRGVLDQPMAKLYKKPCSTLAPGFTLSSLGVLFEVIRTTKYFIQI